MSILRSIGSKRSSPKSGTMARSPTHTIDWLLRRRPEVSGSAITTPNPITLSSGNSHPHSHTQLFLVCPHVHLSLNAYSHSRPTHPQ